MTSNSTLKEKWENVKDDLSGKLYWGKIELHDLLEKHPNARKAFDAVNTVILPGTIGAITTLNGGGIDHMSYIAGGLGVAGAGIVSYPSVEMAELDKNHPFPMGPLFVAQLSFGAGLILTDIVMPHLGEITELGNRVSQILTTYLK